MFPPKSKPPILSAYLERISVFIRLVLGLPASKVNTPAPPRETIARGNGALGLQTRFARVHRFHNLDRRRTHHKIVQLLGIGIQHPGTSA